MKLEKEEKEIIYFLEKIRKMLKILLNISNKKKSLYRPLLIEVDELNQLYETAALKRVFQKKKIEITINQFKTLAKKTEKLIHRQIKVLPQEYNWIEKNDEILNELRNRFISSLRGEDKLVEEEFLTECKEVIGYILTNLKQRYSAWKRTLEELSRYEQISTKLQENIRIESIAKEWAAGSPSALISEEIVFFEKSIEHVNKLIEKTSYLIKQHEEFEEYKKIFNPEELRIIGEQAHELRIWEKDRHVKEILKKERRFGSISINKLVLIHVTPAFPDKGIIRPTYHFKNFLKGFLLKRPRISIHFALNSLVQERHNWGEGVWVDADKTGRISNCSTKEVQGSIKYAILIPLTDIIDRLVTLRQDDSWIHGSYRLTPRCDIIGKSKYINEYKHRGGAAHIIEIPDNSDIREVVVHVMSQKGYEPMKLGQWNWIESLEKEKYSDENKGRDTYGSLEEVEQRHNLTSNEIHFASTLAEIENLFASMYQYIMKDENNPSYGGGWKRLAEHADSFKSQISVDLVKIKELIKSRSDTNISPEEKEALLYLEKRLKKTHNMLSRLKARYAK